MCNLKVSNVQFYGRKSLQSPSPEIALWGQFCLIISDLSLREVDFYAASNDLSPASLLPSSDPEAPFERKGGSEKWMEELRVTITVVLSHFLELFRIQSFETFPPGSSH